MDIKKVLRLTLLALALTTLAFICTFTYALATDQTGVLAQVLNYALQGLAKYFEYNLKGLQAYFNFLIKVLQTTTS